MIDWCPLEPNSKLGGDHLFIGFQGPGEVDVGRIQLETKVGAAFPFARPGRKFKE